MDRREVMIFGEEYLRYNFGEGHPFNQVRVRLALDLMRHVGLLSPEDGLQIVEPPLAGEEDVLLFHTREYLDFVRMASEGGVEYLDDGDTPAFPGCLEATLQIVGGSLEAARLVIAGACDHAFNFGGGLHHAHPGHASGFCIFNDAAVAAIRVHRDYGVERIAYIDVDAHLGDGVMYGLYSEPFLLDVDFHEHGRFLFPGRGFMEEIGAGQALGSKVNVPMLPGTGDSEFLAAFRELVPPLLRKFQPELVIMQCGADSQGSDPLGDLDLSIWGYYEAVRIVHELAHELCNGRLVILGGGGYEIADVAVCWTAVAAAVMGVTPSGDLPEEWRESCLRVTGETAPKSFPSPSKIDGSLGSLADTVYFLKSKLSL